MPDALVIRDSRDSDIGAITDIYVHAVQNSTGTFELDPPDLEEMKRRRQAIMESGYPYLTAECGGKVLGYCYAGSYRPRKAYQHTVEDSVYVAHEHRGQKIGHRLLGALIERCEAKNFRLMVAAIGDSANVSSIRLHAAHRFSHAGVLSNAGRKFERWLDSVLMTRALGPGATMPPKSAC